MKPGQRASSLWLPQLAASWQAKALRRESSAVPSPFGSSCSSVPPRPRRAPRIACSVRRRRPEPPRRVVTVVVATPYTQLFTKAFRIRWTLDQRSEQSKVPSQPLISRRRSPKTKSPPPPARRPRCFTRVEDHLHRPPASSGKPHQKLCLSARTAEGELQRGPAAEAFLTVRQAQCAPCHCRATGQWRAVRRRRPPDLATPQRFVRALHRSCRTVCDFCQQ